ncbi:hypothetical protein ABTX80_34335 [Streptomyces erythrochromogenes]|uniref:hypothetical protein n=1 Tax=Streptomyces erythrochromogenes TaxID=285574 RepID=UPI00332175C8
MKSTAKFFKEALYGALFFRYEGIPEWTLQSEAANGKCIAAIEFLKSKIPEYLSKSE